MIDYKNIKNFTSTTPEEVRLDRWLWAARFYKTRQLSAASLKSGHVELNGRKAKPAKMVRAGDRLVIRKDQFRYEIEVLELREKRVGAELARRSLCDGWPDSDRGRAQPRFEPPGSP